MVKKIENFWNFRSSSFQSSNLFLSWFTSLSPRLVCVSLSLSFVLTEVSTDSLPVTNYCRTPRAGCKSSKEPGLTKRGEKKRRGSEKARRKKRGGRNAERRRLKKRRRVICQRVHWLATRFKTRQTRAGKADKPGM